MSTNKYQNAKHRKTIQEAHYGVALTGAALHHVRLIEHDEHAEGVLWLTWRYRRVKVVRKIVRDEHGKDIYGPEVRKPLSADEKMLAKLNIRRQIQRLRKLRGSLAKSWLRVKKDHAALASVFEVLKRIRDRTGIAYPFANILQLYEHGVRSYKKLWMLSGMEKPNFSREVKRYQMVLEHDKDGSPSTKNITLDQEIREQELILLDAGDDSIVTGHLKRLREKKIEKNVAAWHEAMTALSGVDQEARIELEFEAHKEKWAKKHAEYEARQRSGTSKKKA